MLSSFCRPPRLATLAALVVTLAVVPTSGPVMAQGGPAGGAAAPEAPKAVPGLESTARKVPALLREGTFVTRAPGTLREDTKKQEWIFTPDAADRSGLRREFVLLPNETLGGAARDHRLAPAPMSFEVSGEVFLYHGRNYLLPSLMTPFVAAPPAPAAAPAPAAPPTASKPAAAKPATPAAPTAPVDEEAIAADLEKRLAERIDRLPRPAPPPADPIDRPRREEAAEAPAADPSSAPPTRGDVQVQSRRGQLLRDNATGGWRFVFDGQKAGGEGEPSMAVLPCLALERVESMIRQSDVSLPLVVTGVTTAFEGRIYLLPTIFRVARGGKGINP